MRYAGGVLFLLLLAVTDDVGAASTKLGASYVDVDVDDDGVFDAGSDLLLSAIVDPDRGTFDTGVAIPGYTPPPPPVGIVLEGKVSFVDGAHLKASGAIRVRGHLVAPVSEPDGRSSLRMEAPVIEVAPKAKVTNKGGGELLMVADRLTIGDRTKITTVADLWLGANEKMVIGENVQVRSTGRKEEYEPIFFVLAHEFQVGEGLYLQANDYADCLIEQSGDAATDLVLRRTRVRCGYIEIVVERHPAGNRLHLFDSYLDSRYVEGEIRFWVSRGPTGYLPDAILIENTTIRARGTFWTTPPLP